MSQLLRYLGKWTIALIPLSFVVGSLVALFLWLLEKATLLQWSHPWLLYLLPLAGLLIYFLYKWSGKNAEAGNNLILDEIHQPGGGVPARMTPLVLISTIITHLFGGSAGREGTAVQMGGSMAGLYGRTLRFSVDDTRILLVCGIAAGFGAVFGTPVAGAIFALEVLTIGRINHRHLLPCFIASVLADITCTAYGIHHTSYTIQSVEGSIHHLFTGNFNLFLLLLIVAAGIGFGLAGRLFVYATEFIKRISLTYIKIPWLIPVIGGVIIIGLVLALGTRDYLGLGVMSPNPGGVSILSSFEESGVGYLSWFWKIVFTAVTISMGFKGGEVTPLFFIGATLGGAVAMITGVPADLMAALGFIAVFAAATKTPIACIIMGVELFGGEHILLYAIACFMAYYVSGDKGIYSGQRRAESGVRRA